MNLLAEVEIEADAARAWHILGECWGHIGQWAVPITLSELDGPPCAGATRTCHTARFGPVPPGLIRERLVVFDAAARTFTSQSVEGMPGFVARAQNTWTVEERGDGRCVVRTEASVELRGPMRLFAPLLKLSFSRNGARVLEELKYRVEHGTPHPRKLAAQPELVLAHGC